MQAVGLQLYTLRRPFSEDPVGTLERIREIGYDAVEFAAPLTMDFQAFGKRMQEIGLDCPSVHAGLADMRERPAEVLAMANALGCRFIVMPYVEPQARDWPGVVAALMPFAARAREEGFRTAYHHHDFEFETDGGLRPFDFLVAETDPALVHFELDVYWLKKAGEDPQAVIERLHGRVKLIHLKDMAPDGSMTDVGAGTLDFTALQACSTPAAVAAASSAVKSSVSAPTSVIEPSGAMSLRWMSLTRPYWPSVEASLHYLRALA